MEIEKAGFPTLVSGEITRIAPTEKGHIYSEGRIVIRGVDWRWNLHLHLWSDGKWHIGIENDKPWNQKRSLHGYKNDTGDDFTEAAYIKAASLIVPTITEWAYGHKVEMEQAEENYIQSAINHREEQIAAHQNAIDVLYKELDKLECGEHLNSYSNVQSYYFSMKN